MLANITDKNFETEVLQSDIPVLVDFWAPWCGPCNTVSPIVEDISKNYAGKVKIVQFNIDQGGKESPNTYGIRGIPTLAVFKGGKLVDRLIGAVPKSSIQDMLNKVIK